MAATLFLPSKFCAVSLVDNPNKNYMEKEILENYLVVQDNLKILMIPSQLMEALRLK